MRIIDILNEIANGEEVPKKIIYGKYLWYWCEPCKCYETTTETGHEINLYYYLNKQGNLKDDVEIALLVDDKIEIMREDKEIEFERISGYFDEVEKGTYEYKINQLIRNQKKLIDAVNELKKGD